LVLDIAASPFLTISVSPVLKVRRSGATYSLDPPCVRGLSMSVHSCA
jgi:hypothetical protein